MDLQHWQSQFEAWLANHHNQQDAAHDIFHFRRVWATSRQLSRGLAVDELVVLTACYFHDIVSLAKNHPERHRSSVLAAAKARRILIHDFPGFPAARLAAVCHAIEAHSFSANIAPVTLEAKIVQDADRLEALGAIGLARVFAVSGSLGAALFDAEDPLARRRALNDKQFALDHFQTKLLALPNTMQTARGRELARHNADFLVTYMAKLSAELKGEYASLDATVIAAFSPNHA
ncbi:MULTISPECIES: phosphohydrolase [Citrobacter]|uniref:phosphohydrolase n=1 Tax=Citrobacter TaxID=544 RepID=UPI0015EA52FB|nr:MULTISPECIES: phosphohydrolase [Citrobacter]EHG7583695.1 phosphohydrolase [Citrobacter sedlakii]EIQ7159808.1 phosphohydrolase [Citrobacter sedlakii]MBN6599159.1 phosphohydrolase [Citrobacter sedlakii]QMK45700.1 phosphohydrolase [Citrobacter sp. RHB21-C05]QMK64143.1 phosphohydrolase [Citrobacter sp. RHB21-C01]